MNFWQHIPKPIIGLSPMDGVTDASCRFITAKHGTPDVIFTEFVNVETAFYAPDTLIKDFTYAEIERPVVAQIYGHTPELFYQVAHVVCELGFDGLDINMGCPAKKVAAKGSGAALILNPPLARSIIRSVARGIRDWLDGRTLSDLKIHPELIEKVRMANRARTGCDRRLRRTLIPVSVKTRIGYDQVVVKEWVETLLEEKPAVISLHGRTLRQGYKGSADWEAIARAAELSRNSGTFILGNGDLQNMQEVDRRVREAKVDGVLLGRAAQGNPWIFKTKEQVKRSIAAGGNVSIDPVVVGLEERFKVLLEHAKHFVEHWGPQRFVGMRKHLAWYCHDSPGAAELRSRMVQMNSVDEVIDCLARYLASIGSKPACPGGFPQQSDSQSAIFS